ncbi:unnamed protein product [Macrosiphum euphorbiae]|uniref:Uncharacterized protein n=1 Tax=Macrosiphum euphorbiae TaxID=13131 RepID=A0AAV0WRB5_9HEMI|nr:unnamed protein product [Macrosiphum euphorbiae]
MYELAARNEARLPNLAASHYRWKQTTAASGSSQAEPGKLTRSQAEANVARGNLKPQVDGLPSIFLSANFSIRKTQ